MTVLAPTRVELLVEWLAARDGVAHTSDARRAGFSEHHIRAAVEAGVVLRVRRSWLVTPGCAPDLVAAASVGGRLTCISAAVTRRLWTPDEATVPHIAVPHSASRMPAKGMVLHRATAPVSMRRTETREDAVNILFHVAQCLPRLDALAVWESAIRTRLVDPGLLRGVRWGSARAVELAAVASDLSDSGVETRFVRMLRDEGISVRQQVWLDGHPLDAVIGDRLAAQIDGFAHHQARDRRRDLRADARLALRGYTVLRFDYQQVLFDPEYVLGTIRLAMAQGLHLVR